MCHWCHQRQRLPKQTETDATEAAKAGLARGGTSNDHVLGVRHGLQIPYSIGRHRQPDPRPNPYDPKSLVPNAKGVAQGGKLQEPRQVGDCLPPNWHCHQRLVLGPLGDQLNMNMY